MTISIRPSPVGARVYVLRGPGKYDWTIATLHDETGFVGIASDHGNWSFVWNPNHIGGDTLHEFVADIDAWYAASKLLHRSDRECFDIDGSRRAFFEVIARDRLERRISREEARSRWTEVQEWTEDDYQEHRFPGHESGWCSHPYEWIVHGPTSTARAFVEIVWPGVQQAVREEVARRTAPVQMGASR